MVKILLLFILLLSSSFSQELENNEDLLLKKIQTFVSPSVFEKDRAYLEIIFSPKEEYYLEDNIVDSVKVIKVLKENGILNLFFKAPKELNISFKTTGNSLFFVKIMSDTLRNIGYYRYVTKESNLDENGFTWKISLTSEYATDPVVLSKELEKNSCKIIDIIRTSPTNWTYVIDMQKAKLNTRVLYDAKEVKLKRSLYAYWLDVSQIKKLKITSSYRNSWYPYIAYYDKSLKLLRVIKRDKRRKSITLNMKENTYYLKISDIYTLKNIKDSLVLTPIGQREVKEDDSKMEVEKVY